MSTPPTLQPALDAIELGHLLSTTVESVVAAQDKLDEYTLRRAREYEAAEPGTLALPPLWYTFKSVGIEIELAASVARTSSPAASGAPHLVCRMLDPTSVGLFGYQASSGLRVRVQLAPQGFAQIVPPRDGEQPR